MAEAVTLAALHGTDVVDRALGIAAMAGRFAEGDFESIIVHASGETRGAAVPPAEHSLAAGTAGASWRVTVSTAMFDMSRSSRSSPTTSGRSAPADLTRSVNSTAIELAWSRSSSMAASRSGPDPEAGVAC
jgi:hypothetical protein